MPLLTLIMAVKDGAAFVEEAVRSVQAQTLSDWELIVVDDHSQDATARLVAALGKSDVRVMLAENPGTGKVQAVNHGYGFCRGEHIKIVDGDDLLAPAFSGAFPRLAAAEASYHDALLLDEQTGDLTRIRTGGRFQDMSLEQSLRRIMVSPPCWSWTLARRVADRIFPLPAEVPFPHEDVFLGLMIKKFARVEYVPQPLYIYRQHAGQSYGGLFNFSPAVISRRTDAMLKVIDLVERGEIGRGFTNPGKLLASSRTYFSLLARKPLTWGDLFRARLGIFGKARVAIIRKAPRAAAWLSRRKTMRKTR
jgi:glycosyltransferase involved in cell wall biosynthesis